MEKSKKENMKWNNIISDGLPPEGEPDLDDYGRVMPSGVPELSVSKRSDTYHSADESGNNLRPFNWTPHGPGNYFGQEVDYWAHIPPLPGSVLPAKSIPEAGSVIGKHASRAVGETTTNE